MKTAIGYCRVSTQHQAAEGVSLDAQKARIKSWCKANGYELANVYTDAGISGRKMKNRPALQEALDALQNGNALVFYSLSRLARSTVDLYRISESLNGKNVDMVSLSEAIDTTSAAGRLMFTMLAALAQFESEIISERTREALSHCKANGKVYSAKTPYGYRREDGLLIPKDKEKDVIKTVLKRRKKGDSYAAIADHLNKKGIPSKRGGQWHPSTVFKVARRAAT